ncbi:RagB/SusD family nutrient uptake outer membrane protein, partial [Bacteroides heparinolyticus]
MKRTIYLSIILTLFTACQDYLETNPDSTLDVKIDSEEKIAELLAGAYPEASYFAFLETRTDNVGERVNGIHSRLNEAMYYWEDYDQEDLDTPLNYWNACYAGIAQANQALELLSKYPKSDRVKALYGEAFLLRAYLHFMLVNIWAEPYGTSKSKTSPGIPYLTKPEKNALVDYKRGTVKEVYEKIEKDLKLGISLVDD